MTDDRLPPATTWHDHFRFFTTKAIQLPHPPLPACTCTKKQPTGCPCRSLLVLLAVCSSRGGRVESSESAEPLCDAMMTLTTRNSHPTSVCATCASVEDLRSFQAEHQRSILLSCCFFFEFGFITSSIIFTTTTSIKASPTHLLLLSSS